VQNCEAKLSEYDLSGNKWGSVGMGTSGGQVTWSFATTTGASFAFDYAISDPVLQQAIQAAFDTWEQIANIDFVLVSDSASVDIRLGWDAIDGASNTVAQAATSYSMSTHIYSFAEIRFDTAENWTTDANYTGYSYINFYAVALHEIGHALGLDHSDDPNSIMYSYTGSVTELSAADIAGVQAIYGAATGTAIAAGPTTNNDVLTGSEMSNAIAALAGNDSVSGLGGNDTLTGNAGSDTIDGGTGNDAIWAGGDDLSADTMYGGSGSDTMAGGAGGDVIYGDAGTDLLFGGDGNDYLGAGLASGFSGDGAGAQNTAWGGAGNDTIAGDDTSDLLGGGAGSDLIRAYGGNDVIYGGGGSGANDDAIYGGAGYDTIFGGSGADRLYGEDDSDVIYGGDGNDIVDGGTGADGLWGGAGNDTLTGGSGADTFGFSNGSGADLIADFSSADGDRLDLGGQTYQLDTDGQGNLELVLSGGGTVSLDGYQESDFNAGWIL
jgi:Ca2+-binding RTX toxin-like protein